MATQYDTYFAATIVVPNDSANHQLLTLMKAIDPIAPIRTKYFTLQVDSASADSLLLGSGPTDMQGNTSPSSLSATNFGRSYTPGSEEAYYGIMDEDFSMARFWVRTTGAGTATLHIQCIRG